MDILCVLNNFYLKSEKRSIRLNGDGIDTMAIKNSINGNRLAVKIDVLCNR